MNGNWTGTQWARWLRERGIQDKGFRLPQDVPVRFKSVEAYLDDLAREAVCLSGNTNAGQSPHGGRPEGDASFFSIGSRINTKLFSNLSKMKLSELQRVSVEL